MLFFTLLITAFLAGCGTFQDKTKGHIECRNVEIYKNHAFGACRDVLVIKHLKTGKEKRLFEIKGERIVVDALSIADGFLFTMGMNDHLKMYDLSNPLFPVLVDADENVPARFYTGIDARNGFVAVSGGLSNSTLVSYSKSGFTGKQMVKSVEKYFGRPDVAIVCNQNNSLSLVYSLDVKLTYKWGMKIINLEKDIQEGGTFIPFESGISPFELLDYSPTNFPITAVNLKETTFISHWKTKSIKRFRQGKGFQDIKLSFSASHMATDGAFIYLVDKNNHEEIFRLDPDSSVVTPIKVEGLNEPIHLSVDGKFLAIADKTNGIVITELSKD